MPTTPSNPGHKSNKSHEDDTPPAPLMICNIQIVQREFVLNTVLTAFGESVLTWTDIQSGETTVIHLTPELVVEFIHLQGRLSCFARSLIRPHQSDLIPNT